MASLPKSFISAEEYLAIERASEDRHEYVNGEMWLMSGASPKHDRITANISDYLSNAKLQGCSCLKYTANMKVYLKERGVYCYPDLTICCGKAEYFDGQEDVLLNPTIVVEVLSPSRMAYDIGDKCFYYRRNESVKHVLLVSQDVVKVGHWLRNENGDWDYREYAAREQSVALPEMQLELPLQVVYEQVI